MLRIPSILFLLAAPSLALSTQETGQAVAESPPEAPVDAAEESGEEPAEEASTEAEEPSGPRLTTEADWQQWERLGGATLSPDGRWAAYTISRNDGTSELRLRVLATDSTEVFEEGRSPEFSSDGKWMAFSIGKSRAEAKKLSAKKQPVESKLGLFDLVRGESSEVESVRNSEFSGDGLYLAMQHYAAKGDKNGSDVVIRELATGTDTHFGRVTSFRWSDSGAWLAFTTGAPGQSGNGLRVFNAATGMLRTLDSAECDYVGMTWREDSADLAVMRKTSHEDDEDATFEVMAWRNVAKAGTPPVVFDHLKDEQCPEELRVVEFNGLRWTDDGAALAFGLKEWKDRPASLDEEDAEEDTDGDAESEDSAEGDGKEEEKEDAGKDKADSEPSPDADKGKKESKGKSMRETLKKAPGVEIWHARDIQIVPRQKITARSDERETIAALYWLDEKKLVQLENDVAESSSLLEGGRYALGRDETPYEEEQRFSATVSDLYAIDAKTGSQEKILERVKYAITGDPKGRYILFVRDGDIWSHDLEKDSSVNLTKDMDTAFINQENSSLTDEKPPYGVGGWTEDGRTVLLY
ncbi:MAG: hypothetical protein AAGG01_04665, partial [Planctomycetota bacterium]